MHPQSEHMHDLHKLCSLSFPGSMIQNKPPGSNKVAERHLANDEPPFKAATYKNEK